jgi:hypothetical protein
MAVKINNRALELAIEKPVERAFRQKAIELAEGRLEETKEEFLIEFKEHPVSQEIEEGERAEGDLGVPGNLFSFIGFEQGSTPVEDLSAFLNEHIHIRNLATPRYDKTRKRYLFDVVVPSRDTIAANTPMPWGTSRSWVYGIETGIIGLNHYLSIQLANQLDKSAGRKRQREEFPHSRSTTAIQSKGVVSKGIGAFTPRQYLTQLLKTFESNLQ